MAEGGWETPAEKQHGALCQICDVTKPSLFCKECIQSMCESCKKQHDKVHNFDKHVIAPLCNKHGQPLTHICHTCIVGMCIKCILKDHIDHGKEFDTYTEGTESIRKKSLELKEKVSESKAKIKNEILLTEKKLLETKGIKTAFKKLRAVYVDKISKVDNVLNDIDEKIEAKGDLTLRSLQEILSDCSRLETALDIKGKCDQDLIADYKKNDSRGLGLLEKAATITVEKFEGMRLEDYGTEYSLCLQDAGISFFDDITSKKLKQVLRYTGEGNTKLKCPVDVKILSESSAIVADMISKCVFVINREGALIRTYKPHVESGNQYVRSVAVHQGYCFILQERGITKINMERQGEHLYKDLGVRFMQKMIEEGDDFIIVDSENRQVVKYNLDSNETTEFIRVQTAVREPFIGKTVSGSYLMTFADEHFVREYDVKGALVRTIGCQGNGEGQLQNPFGIATTPSSHILVADWSNKRVTCFNQDGSFSKHLLTKEDGIMYPYALACKYPFLWVTEVGDVNCVKCFKFC